MKKTMKAVILAAALGLGALGSVTVQAQEAAPVATETTSEVTNEAESVAPAFEHAKPVEGVGMPMPGETNFQEVVTPNGHYARWMHNSILLPLITAIAIFVLGLLLWVMVVYRRREGREPSRTSHNTLIEIIWTLVPVLILIGVAIPSIDLLAKQFKPAPKDALTIKVTGYQWYWGYEYPDNEIGEYVSNMLPDEEALAKGEPRLLGVDNRMVVPVGRPIKLIVTGADVIHSFAMPSFWVKIDAVPGRLNEVSFTVEKEGVYYGQCSELCGDRHGFMPIAVEAVSPERFAQWVASQGGTMPGEAAAAPVAAPAEPAAAPAETTAAAPVAAPAKS